MFRPLRFAPALLTLAFAPQLSAQSKPTIEQFLSPASPLEITSAKKADRIAWMAYERGMRNVYTAAAPDFKPVRLTKFLEDDGTDLTEVHLSDDGSVVVFVRGSVPNRQGWVANPSHDPNGAERAIWAVRTSGGPAWRLADGNAPELSPDGRAVLYVKDGQIYRARITQPVPDDSMDHGEKPFIDEWGRQANPRWSPDGTKIAFVSERENHALIGLYDARTRTVNFISPSVDCDADPIWSPDGKQIAFTRRPGTPFGLQAQEGNGGIGNPAGPANAQGAAGRGARGGGGAAFGGCTGGGGRGGGGGARGTPTPPGGRGEPGAPGAPPGPPDGARGGGRGAGGGRGRRGGGGASGDTTQRLPRTPGLYTSTLKGGYTLSLMVANVATGQAHEVWHNQPHDTLLTNIANMKWASGNIVFPYTPAGDEWERYYAINLANPATEPVRLTTTDGLIEDATSAALSSDGKTFYYCTNAKDIERRHIWAVPTVGGTPVQVSTGDGIETYPAPLASGKKVAVLYFNAKQPASVALVPAEGGTPKIIFPTLPKDFPQAEHVVPQIVITKAADGLEIHNQLFLPKDLKPGERRPTMIFVHGGPQRQMLPGYHYMQFYHWAYAFNQWLASQGYIVMSINYRSGIGYGRAFRQAPNTNARGNSEYQDVLAGAKYLQSRADVDSTRLGIWGLSYGGLLTSQALARNSDIFVAGADLAGVHLYGNSLDSANLGYQSSAISHIDTWKSPVFLSQGDDDRNVDFAQMVGLVQLLRAHGVYYELTVIPDDVHESLVHSRWISTFTNMGDFLHRFVWDRQTPPQ